MCGAQASQHSDNFVSSRSDRNAHLRSQRLLLLGSLCGRSRLLEYVGVLLVAPARGTVKGVGSPGIIQVVLCCSAWLGCLDEHEYPGRTSASTTSGVLLENHAQVLRKAYNHGLWSYPSDL